MKKHLPAVLTGIGLLILWQVIAMCINAAYILPSPTQIAVKIWELREPLFTVHTPATMLVTLIGLLISVVLGVGLAVVMERFEYVERALYPVIVTTQTIPVTAIAPLFVLWLGYGIWSKVLVAVLITFFPITISVHDGLKSAKRENEELLGLWNEWYGDIFKLKFPAALPSFFSAIKMAIPLSILGAAMGEWLGAQSGLGYFSKRMMTQLDGAGVFAPVVVLAVCAMLVVAVISAIERKLITWRKEI
ncbi:MAG: ABC transporter permease [[Eubacterium] siraeum]